MLESGIPRPSSGSGSGSVADLSARRQKGHQLSFLCLCGEKPIELKTLGCCRRCYDRRYHSSRFFGGMRERVLERDRFRCRACGAQRRLLVHHRDQSNEPNLLVTLCIRCHVRIHRSLGVRYWLSGLLLKLWRELHQHDPMQLQLTLRFVAKKDRSEHFSEQRRCAGLAPFSRHEANRGVRVARTIRTAPAVFGPGER
jgi:hypothetical protein